MKKLSWVIVLVFSFFIDLGAQTQLNVKFKSPKAFSFIKADQEFVVDSIVYVPKFDRRTESSYTVIKNTYVLSINQGGNNSWIAAMDLPKSTCFAQVDDNLNNYWLSKNIASLKTISEISDLFSTISDMEEDANQYLSLLYKYGLVYDDPYLESYLYSIVSKIAPQNRADGFPYDLKIVIVKDESINACVFPNGILLLNIGLLSELHTEDELIAALSHEIGHFVSNHALINKRFIIKETARAEFWAAFATSLAAITEGVIAANNYYYFNGSLTRATALLSQEIAADVIKRMGLEFSKEQEMEADEMSIAVLNYLGYDKNALATLFQRMTDALNAEGNWAAYYLSGDHPSLKSRIKASGKPYKKTDSEFEKRISFVVTETAISKYNRGRFAQAIKYVSQNIDNNVATDDDYLIKALCTINLHGDPTHNQEALSLVNKAKMLNPNNPNILKSEIIVNLRCGNNEKAKELLTTYMENLSSTLSKINNKESNLYSYFHEEYEWARKMVIKVNGL